MKLEIVGGISSIVGYAEKRMESGEIGLIRTQGSYFSKNDLDDPDILSIKNQINSTMSGHIFPLFLHHFSSKELPEKFRITSVRIEMFADESKNIITFNKDAKIHGMFKLKTPKKIKKNDPILESDVEDIRSLDPQDRDPNSAIMVFAVLRGEWYGFIDLIYNRDNASKKNKISLEYIKSATHNFKESNLKPFYNDVWSAYELLAESILLLHNALKLKDSHKKISKLFGGFCETQNLQYYDDYKQIESIRNSARYGPPHESKIDMKKNALKYLTSLLDFSKFVEGFLENRQVKIKDPELTVIKQLDIRKNP